MSEGEFLHYRYTAFLTFLVRAKEALGGRFRPGMTEPGPGPSQVSRGRTSDTVSAQPGRFRCENAGWVPCIREDTGVPSRMEVAGSRMKKPPEGGRW